MPLILGLLSLPVHISESWTAPSGIFYVLKEGFGPGSWPGWALVLVGIWAARIAIRTLTAIEHEATVASVIAEAAKDNAAAAKASAQAAVDSERAWITARPAILSPELHAVWEQGDPLPADSPWVHLFPVRFQNFGKTPAQIDEVAIRYVLLGNLSELKEPPEYGEAAAQNGYLLVPREKMIFSVPLASGGTLKKWQVAAINAQQLFLYAYGFVGYRDVYGPNHGTCFGYVYHFPQGGLINFQNAEFRRGGPPAYNKAT